MPAVGAGGGDNESSAIDFFVVLGNRRIRGIRAQGLPWILRYPSLSFDISSLFASPCVPLPRHLRSGRPRSRAASAGGSREDSRILFTKKQRFFGCASGWVGAATRR